MEIENRYIIIKRSDAAHLSQTSRCVLDAVLREIRDIRLGRGKPFDDQAVTALVIEHDWPEYPKVLAMLSKRVNAEHARPTRWQRFKDWLSSVTDL